MLFRKFLRNKFTHFFCNLEAWLLKILDHDNKFTKGCILLILFCIKNWEVIKDITIFCFIKPQDFGKLHISTKKCAAYWSLDTSNTQKRLNNLNYVILPIFFRKKLSYFYNMKDFGKIYRSSVSWLRFTRPKNLKNFGKLYGLHSLQVMENFGSKTFSISFEIGKF